MNQISAPRIAWAFYSLTFLSLSYFEEEHITHSSIVCVFFLFLKRHYVCLEFFYHPCENRYREIDRGVILAENQI